MYVIYYQNFWFFTFTAEPQRFSTEFVNVPSSLIFQPKHHTTCWGYSSSFTENGNILVGCDDGLKLFDRNSKSLKTLALTPQSIYSVTEHRHIVYVLQSNGVNSCKVEMYLPNLQDHQTLFKLKYCGSYVPGMDVSDNYVVVNYPSVENPPNAKLTIYNLQSKQIKHISGIPEEIPFLLPDDQLLIPGGDHLVKYSIEDGKLTAIWACEGLTNVSYVCADHEGLIYAPYTGTHSLCIISPEGNYYIKFCAINDFLRS